MKKWLVVLTVIAGCHAFASEEEKLSDKSVFTKEYQELLARENPVAENKEEKQESEMEWLRHQQYLFITDRSNRH